jgi:E3 ubiquitin-protein ligase listerin
VQELPSAFVDETTLARMCHLVADPSIEVGKMAYEMLQRAARKRTEQVVVEAGVDSEGTYEPRLPAELLTIIVEQQLPEVAEVSTRRDFGYLLAWMLVFDLFSGAVRCGSKYRASCSPLRLIYCTF